MRPINKADVVLALGSRLGPFGTLPQYGIDYWPASAALIQVDADPRVLGLVKPVAVAICGDAREAALALGERLSGRGLACEADRQLRAESVRGAVQAWSRELEGWDQEQDPCVRERIPITAVVFNNGQWGAEKKNQVDFFANRFVGVELEGPSWAE